MRNMEKAGNVGKLGSIGNTGEKGVKLIHGKCRTLEK